MNAETKFTNRLIDETSPYLLQHVHNPVDWYPWGDEAFEKAKAEDKPVLVSIGYSACHWCHVMEHESFEDERTAAIMNEHFVNIKVDMEERPDVDQIYMNFVQLTTGRGGWPMNVFLLPDKRPFFGGTYFPPSPRYGMASWSQILMGIAEAYREKRDEIEHSTVDILGELRRMSVVEPVNSGLRTEMLDAAFASFSKSFDPVNGGFGGAPKFPPAMSLEFLLRYHKRTGEPRALEIVEKTLTKMACGGIYDQLGGGFHRYAVDAIWLVPHFEKMLYDNAQLVRVYLHAYQVLSEPPAVAGGLSEALDIASELNPGDQPPATAGGSDTVIAGVNKAEFFKRIAVETLEYIRREMLDASGGFYSTQDADSEGEEGKFFVWTPEEIEAVLSDRAAEFNEYFDVTTDGNFEGKNILNINGGNPNGSEGVIHDNESASPNTLPTGRVSAFEAERHTLFLLREKRIKPGRDEKVLTAWNGLMLAAFADAAAVLDNKDYLEIAEKNADFILSELSVNGRLLRTWKQGRAKLNAYVEDYANVIDGLLVLFQASGDGRHLSEAKRLADDMIVEFWDEEGGGFFFTSNDHEELIVRNKDFYDNATPSGNSVAADVLLRLAKIYGDEKYERFGVAVLRLAASQIAHYPQGFGRALSALEFHLSPTKEIVVAGDRDGDLARAVQTKYLPDAVIVKQSDSVESADLRLLDGKHAADGQTTVYVCENFVCERPVTSVDALLHLLA